MFDTDLTSDYDAGAPVTHGPGCALGGRGIRGAVRRPHPRNTRGSASGWYAWPDGTARGAPYESQASVLICTVKFSVGDRRTGGVRPALLKGQNLVARRLRFNDVDQGGSVNERIETPPEVCVNPYGGSIRRRLVAAVVRHRHLRRRQSRFSTRWSCELRGRSRAIESPRLRRVQAGRTARVGRRGVPKYWADEPWVSDPPGPPGAGCRGRVSNRQRAKNDDRRAIASCAPRTRCSRITPAPPTSAIPTSTARTSSCRASGSSCAGSSTAASASWWPTTGLYAQNLVHLSPFRQKYFRATLRFPRS